MKFKQKYLCPADQSQPAQQQTSAERAPLCRPHPASFRGCGASQQGLQDRPCCAHPAANRCVYVCVPLAALFLQLNTKNIVTASLSTCITTSEKQSGLNKAHTITVHTTGAMFGSVVEVALAVPREYPSHKMLRARFISFLHRMVEGLQVCKRGWV